MQTMDFTNETMAKSEGKEQVPDGMDIADGHAVKLMSEARIQSP